MVAAGIRLSHRLRHGDVVARFADLKGLMMWDADPFPRWPWAWGLGILAVGSLKWVKWRW